MTPVSTGGNLVWMPALALDRGQSRVHLSRWHRLMVSQPVEVVVVQSSAAVVVHPNTTVVVSLVIMAPQVFGRDSLKLKIREEKSRSKLLQISNFFSRIQKKLTRLTNWKNKKSKFFGARTNFVAFEWWRAPLHYFLGCIQKGPIRQNLRPFPAEQLQLLAFTTT